MEPTRNCHTTLVDLLDRVLDKGLVIHADLIVSVAGIPLLGVNLKAALAGMETMLKYGILQPWDESTRAWEKEMRVKKERSLFKGENVVLKMIGSYFTNYSLYSTWRFGRLYLTEKRLIIINENFTETVVDVPVNAIRGIKIKKEKVFDNKDVNEMHVFVDGKGTAKFRASDVEKLRNSIEELLEGKGINLQNDFNEFQNDERYARILTTDEEIYYNEKMWLKGQGDSDYFNNWTSGRLFITNKKLCFWNEFEKKLVIEVPIDKIYGSSITILENDNVFTKDRKALKLNCSDCGVKNQTLLSGGDLEKLECFLRETIKNCVSVSTIDKSNVRCSEDKALMAEKLISQYMDGQYRRGKENLCVQ